MFVLIIIKILARTTRVYLLHLIEKKI